MTLSTLLTLWETQVIDVDYDQIVIIYHLRIIEELSDLFVYSSVYFGWNHKIVNFKSKLLYIYYIIIILIIIDINIYIRDNSVDWG